ncbi:MAG: thioredoxin fold domain-containing protein [Bacteroidota bacterium]
MKPFAFILVLALFTACSNNTEQTDASSQTQTETQAAAKAPAKTVKNPAQVQAQPAKAPAVGEGKINWVSLEEAQKLTKKEPKKLLVDVYTAWCGPCKMMDRFTFSDDKVADYVNENFYAVKFNGESADPVTFRGKTYENPNFVSNRPPNRRNSPHQITGAFGIRGYPTLIVLDQDLKKVKDIVGYRKPDQLMGELQAL